MALCLLYDIARACVLAVLEVLRLYLYPWHVPCAADGVVFYEGTVVHKRRAPVAHSFSYRVRYCVGLTHRRRLYCDRDRS